MRVCRDNTAKGALRAGLLAAALAAIAAALPDACSAEEIVLKFAVIVPEKSVWGEHMKAVADEIKEKTGGAVRLKVYYGGVQGDELNVIQKMRIGQLHGAGLMAYGLSKVCPDSVAMAIPMLFKDADEAIWVRGKMEGFYQKQARERGFEIVAWTNQGYTYCFSKDKVVDFATLRGAKPWELEKDSLSRAFFQAESIPAIPLSVGDVNTALESGLVRTVFAPPTGMIIMQWHTRVSYRLDMGIFYSFGVVVVANEQWAKIPEPHQKTMKELFLKHSTSLNLALEKQNTDALKVLDSKLQVLTPSEKGLEEFRSVTAKVEKEMTGKDFSEEAIRQIKTYLDECRRNSSEKQKQ